ncbi:MAG: hypothetical protein VB948_09855 [Pseudomonadales bacterium]
MSDVSNIRLQELGVIACEHCLAEVVNIVKDGTHCQLAVARDYAKPFAGGFQLTQHFAYAGKWFGFRSGCEFEFGDQAMGGGVIGICCSWIVFSEP